MDLGASGGECVKGNEWARGDGIKETLWTSGFGGVVYEGYLHQLNCPRRKAGHTPHPMHAKTGGEGVDVWVKQIKR